ncbi:S-layer homology domain-containing protein [Ureibacillus sp. NPDC094379]
MANQPKKYKKFVATAATATLVASAIVPVASAATPSFSDIAGNDHEAAIKAIAELGYINGKADGTFAPNETVTRGQVALMLGKWALAQGVKVPADYATKEYFNDLPASATDENKQMYALVKAAGIFEGSNGSLNPGAKISRQHMAVVLNSAFEAVTGTSLVELAGDTSKVEVADINKVSSDYRDEVKALKALGITAVSNFNPTGTVTRGQFASFLNATVKAEVQVVTKVDAVKAINSNTLEVTGSALKNLKVEDITIEGISVKSVTPAADGKSATVELASALLPGETVKVTAAGKSFDVTYTVSATGVTVVEGQTYDDDTADQFVKILVDGKAVTAQELIVAGYNVEFEAYTSKAATTPADIFDGSVDGTSTTGELDSSIASTDYYVKVTLTTGSDVMTSALTKITVKNTNISADTITSALLFNIKNNVEQTSTTLVTGDTAKFAEIDIKSGGVNEVIEEGNFTVKSSDEAVVSVDKDNDYTLTAQGPGTATLTISYGGTTYTKTITVKNEARKATSAKVNKTSVPVIEGGTATVKVQLLDQYGDPMDYTAGTDVQAVFSDTDIAAEASFTDPTGDKLEGTLTIDGVDSGNAIITFRNAAGAKLGSTSVRVNVTENATISKYTLAVDNDISNSDVSTINTNDSLSLTKNDISTDATVDTGDDRYVKINIKGLNNAGVEIVGSPVAGTNYEVSRVTTSDLNVLDTSFGANNDGVSVQDGYILVKAGTEAGTATIIVKDLTNGNVTASIKVTVTDVGVTVKGVNFKNVAAPNYATTLDVKDFLSYTNSSNNLIITGLTLTKSAAQAIRLDADGTTLYIDKDADGLQSSGDVVVGSLVISTTGTIANNSGNVDITNVINGVDVATGDDGYVIFKVLNSGKNNVVDGDDQVVASKAVKIDF